MRPQRRRFLTLGVAELERRTLMDAQAPSGIWLGQDGHDFVGLASNSGPDDIQDLHFSITGLPAGLTVVRAQVDGLGGGQWMYNGPWGPSPAAWVQAPGATTADLYIDPYQVETGRQFTISLTFNDGTSAAFNVQGGAADPNLRMLGAAASAHWAGQDGRDRTGPGPSVGPDGVQDVVIALEGLSDDVAITSIDVLSPAGIGWSFGLNAAMRPSAEVVRNAGEPTKADLFVNPLPGLAGQTLTLTIGYANGKSDTTTIVAGASDSALRMPAPAPVPLAWGPITAGWIGQDGLDLTGPGDVHVSLAGLPAGRIVISAMLSDPARSLWIYQANGAPAGAIDPSAYPLAFRRSTSDPALGDITFAPTRDETGSTLTLTLTLDDGAVIATRFSGGPSDLSRRTVPVATTSVVAHAGDDLAALVTQFGSIHLSAGTYFLDQPLMLPRPVAITADPGTTLLFSQGANDPAWTTAINVQCGNTTLDGFAVRFSGPIRWTTGVNSGPSVIGNSFELNGGLQTPLFNITISNLDLVAPPASTAWEEAPRLIWMTNAESGAITGNSLKGGMVEFNHGPWRVTDNHYLGTVPNTYSYGVFAGHFTHDLVLSNNTVEEVGPSGKTWRFLVMTGFGYNDVVSDNNVVGIGSMDTDAMPNPNAREIILTEAYHISYEGAPAAISADGWIVQIPMPQGGAARTGDVVSILSGPDAGQWRTIAQALSPTTYLLDAPMSGRAPVISITTGFVGETFRSNTVDVRGSSVSYDFVLVGNHFGTQVVDNHFLGGNRSFYISAVASESPVIWGWSHVPMLDLTIQGNVFEDAVHGGLLNIEHSDAIKTYSGRTYMTASLLNNTIVWSDAFFDAYEQANPSGMPGTFTVGDLTTAGPDELRLNARDNAIKFSAHTAAGATWYVHSATIGGRPVVDQSLQLPPVFVAVVGVPTAPRVAFDTGLNASDGVTNDGRISFDAVQGAAGYEYSLSGQAGTFQSIGTATTFLPAGLVEGTNTVYVRAYDSNGTRSESVATTIVLDTVAPRAVLGLTAFSDGRVQFQGTGPGDVYEYLLGGTTTYVALGSNTTFSATGVLTGPRTVQVHAIDLAGNVGVDAITSLVPQWMPVVRPPTAKPVYPVTVKPTFPVRPVPTYPNVKIKARSVVLPQARMPVLPSWTLVHGKPFVRPPHPFKAARQSLVRLLKAARIHAASPRPRAVPTLRLAGHGAVARGRARLS